MGPTGSAVLTFISYKLTNKEASKVHRYIDYINKREARAERIRGSWLDPVEAADSDTDQGTEVEINDDDESVQSGISLVSRSQSYSSSEPADPITTQLGEFIFTKSLLKLMLL